MHVCQTKCSGSGGIEKVKQQNIVIKTLAKKQQVQVDKAEKAYQDEIFECREKSAPSWWDENGIYVGAAVGLVVGIVISCVAISATTAANSATNSATK